MHKLLRLYNQNRIKIWTIIIAIIFIIAVIQILNNAAKEKNRAKLNNTEEAEETTLNNVVSYSKQSESIISDENVSETYQDTFGEIIDTFYTYCINHETEKAYNMLSTNMKTISYPNLETFEQGYCKNKFEGDMQYSFQAWSNTSGQYTYVVNIFENMLSTGKSSKESYIEDYITIIAENGEYKVNVDGYINRTNLNKKGTSTKATIEALYVDQYMNYAIYTFQAKNNTNQAIWLDTKQDTKKTYLLDNKENKYDALVYENKDNDLLLEAQESKKISIKFSVAYRTSLKIQEINFSKIIENDEYLADKNKDGETLKIEM